MSEARAVAGMEAAGIPFEIHRYDPTGSLWDTARARGIPASQVVKSLVVRRGEDDYLFVLVPGDRAISWARLRALLGVKRVSMPDAADAQRVTGYERGTITPFGSERLLPVIADERVLGGPAAIGAGAHGVSATVDGDRLVAVLAAQVADVTQPLSEPDRPVDGAAEATPSGAS